jgi:uncharacterized protein (UPF0548 family)
MFTFRKPTDADVIAYLIGQRDAPFSYGEVEATRGPLPAGYDVDRHRVCLGRGREVFERAKAAIRAWKMFPPEMAELCWPDKPIAAGTVVGVLFRALCFWSLNPARIVYTFDEENEEACGSVERFGFAYGTLPDHLERGEERFSVEWRRADDSVWYELLAISRAQHWLAKFGYPYVRREQRRFRHLSGHAMQRATQQVAISSLREMNAAPSAASHHRTST